MGSNVALTSTVYRGCILRSFCTHMIDLRSRSSNCEDRRPSHVWTRIDSSLEATVVYCMHGWCVTQTITQAEKRVAPDPFKVAAVPTGVLDASGHYNFQLAVEARHAYGNMPRKTSEKAVAISRPDSGTYWLVFGSQSLTENWS